MIRKHSSNSETMDQGQVRSLLRRARAGSKESFGQLLEGCREYLLLIAGQEMGLDLRGKAGASDLVQETFAAAHQDFDRFSGETPAELKAWLRQILLHRLSKFYRCYRTTQQRCVGREVSGDDSEAILLDTLFDSDATSPSQHAVRQEKERMLYETLQQLPADHREVVLLRFRDQQSFPQIADRLGRTPDAVRMLLKRALVQLARLLESRGL